MIDDSFAFLNENAPGYSNHSDEAINFLLKDLTKITKVQGFLANFVLESSKKLEAKLDNIVDTIGQKLSLLDKALDIPHLWGTIYDLVTKGEEDKVLLDKTFEKVLRSSQAKTLDLFDNLKDELQITIDKASKLSVKKVTDIRRSFFTIAKATKQGVEKNMDRLESLQIQLSKHAHIGTSNSYVGLEDRLVLLKQGAARARAAECDTIKFYNLGFRSTTNSNAWLTLNTLHKEFLYMINFHLNGECASENHGS